MDSRICVYCGSSNIKKGINIAMNAEVSKIGLKYRRLSVFRAVEPLYADLCLDCGSITRFWVNNTDKKWETD
ncbi:MAG: hypothetical protein AB7E34_04370 [Acidaminococcaceae bacterium]